MCTWLQCPSTTWLDDIPCESSYVDNISFKVLLILSSYRVLKATTEPEESFPSSPIKPYQPKYISQNILQGSKIQKRRISGTWYWMPTLQIGWDRVARLFKFIKCVTWRISPCLQSSSSISVDWLTRSVILIKQTATFSTSWEIKTKVWVRRSSEIYLKATKTHFTVRTWGSSYWRRLHSIGTASMKGEGHSEGSFLQMFTTVERATLWCR